MRKLLYLLARVLISVIFVVSGVGHIFNWESAEGELHSALYNILNSPMSSQWLHDVIEKVIPMTGLFLFLSTALLVLGGLLVFLGIRVRLGSFMLMVYLIASTLVMHHFWLYQGQDRLMELTQFMKNLAIFGGVLLILIFPNAKESSISDETT